MVAFPCRYVRKPFRCLVAVLLVASAMSVLLIGCGGSGGKLQNSMGPIQPITIKAQFPSAQGRAHDTITSAWVGVTGPGMTPITQQMTYDASTFTATGTVDVPTGSDRTFQVDAKDAEDAIVFTGQTTGVELIGGETLQLDMTVEAAFTEPTASGIDYTKLVFAQTLTGHENSVYSVAFSPDGSTLASGSYDKTVKLWDSQTGAVLRTLVLSANVWSVAFSPDGNTLASGAGSGLKLWDAQTGALKTTLAGHGNGITSVVFSPDGKTLASGSWDKTVRLWDVQTGLLKQTLAGHGNGILSVAFSPDGETLASGSFDSTVKLWDAQTGGLKLTLVFNSMVSVVAFSPDGKTLVLALDDGDIHFLEPETGAEKLLIHKNPNIRDVAFSPDGTTLATGRAGVPRLIDSQTGTQTWPGFYQSTQAPNGASWIFSVTFSPDGKTLASGYLEGTVNIWRVP